jgi:FlaA1/EpsC-like NDP-sugar epimerase
MEKPLEKMFKNKKILVTGGTGFIGGEIVRNLLEYKPVVVRIFSNDEDNTFRMMQELGNRDDVRFLIGDVRDKERVKLAMEGIDIVYHAAALKHVPLCEYNPFEAIKTNVLGTQNVIEAALANGVSKLITISTDKAVNPVNAMGATKLLAEKLTIDANYYKGSSKTILSCVRFGNVTFSRGSVIPVFEDQIKQKKMITMTDETMTRFMMSIKNTIDLVFQATTVSKGGEIFILKMPVVRLGDLADIAIEVYAKKYGYRKEEIKKNIIGLRPGEKMFEELMTETEANKAFETDTMLIIPPPIGYTDVRISPSEYPNARQSALSRYISKDAIPLSKDNIRRWFT